MSRLWLNQVEIRNYKNIATATVQLQPLTVLVGPNGAGKSNFVDALSFVADSLNRTIQTAFYKRGGLSAIRRRAGRGVKVSPLALSLKIDLSEGIQAEYALEISVSGNTFEVARERCSVIRDDEILHEFEVQKGFFTREVPGIRPRIEPDRLALTVVSAVKEFRPVYDLLSRIRHYNPQPEQLYGQSSDLTDGDVLLPDLSNAASVLRRIREQEGNGNVYERICRLLGRIVPGIASVQPKLSGRQELLEFIQEVGAEQKLHFEARNMSDGTLRVLGVLLAIYQPNAASLIALEEPESTIHPAATEVLMDALIDGTARSQIVLTTHSPDILDNKKLKDNQILIVESVQGAAQITPLAELTRDIIRERLYTPGELLRQDELQPDRSFSNRAIRRMGRRMSL